jgi:hypothetical protein
MLIYSQLSAGLQQRLAQLALLQQRAAVLARLPALTLTKGKPVRWAATPAPLLLRQVMLLATLDDQPRLSALLLRNWFQHKRELYYHVRRALFRRSYRLPAPSVLPVPATTVMRLAPKDVGPGGRFFCPDGQPVPDTDASAEECTLMAELLGWCVRRPGPTELDCTNERVDCLRMGYEAHRMFEEMLTSVLTALPPTAEAAQLARQGMFPLTLDAETGRDLNWPEYRPTLAAVLASLYRVAHRPAPALEHVFSKQELDEVLDQLEDFARASLFMADTRAWLLESLGQVQRVRHRQQPDFAALAPVHAWARELAARIMPDTGGDALQAVWQEARPLLALLDAIEDPDHFGALAPLDEQAADMQALEAAVPPACFTALLLRKLLLPEASATEVPAVS